MVTLIMTARLKHIDPLALLADVLARIANIPAEPAARIAALAVGKR